VLDPACGMSARVRLPCISALARLAQSTEKNPLVVRCGIAFPGTGSQPPGVGVPGGQTRHYPTPTEQIREVVP
jgi:hypothetical protein